MTSLTTPKFWLQVKENYLLDNFDALVCYLRDYNFEADKPLTDDLASTLYCLESFLLRLNDRINTLSVHDPFEIELLPGKKGDMPTLMALFGTGILCARKFHRDASPFIAGFINLIFHSGRHLQSDIVKRLWDIAVAAVQGCKFINIGFSWLDITGCNEENIGPMTVKFAQHATFSPAPDDSMIYCENNGLICFSNSQVTVSNLNFSSFMKTETMDLADLPGLLKIKIARDNRLKLRTFDEVYAASKDYFNALAAFKPALEKKQKEYADGEEIFVRITSVNQPRITARTVDPSYRIIESPVFYGNRNERLPSEDDIFNTLQPGDIIKVKYHPGEYMRFNLTESLWRYYMDSCVELANTEVEAINIGEYPKGTLWLTSGGFTVSIDNNWLAGCPKFIKDKVEEAAFYKHPLSLKTYAKVATPPNIYANVNTRGPEPDDFTANDAKCNFMFDFIDSCADEAPQFTTFTFEKSRPADYGVVAPLANILCHIVDNNDMAASEKLEYVIAANALAYISGHTLDAAVLTFNRRYLARIVDFSSNRPVRPLPLPDDLVSIPQAADWSSIVGKLTEYKPALIERSDDTSAQPVAEKVARLVEASNNLAGAISLNEQNNIKLAIVQALGVEEEYVPLISEKQNFGQESDTLEFKQSVVYPPVNRRRFIGTAADPSVQKWAILKAVNGFLNSKFGGDLLIGVNDKGYATGVESDFDELFKAGLIKAPDLDNYSRYVSDLLREAFAEYGSDRSAADIYQKNISPDVETALNGKHIMRISVRPNRSGRIRFVDSNRPAAIDEAYIRLNCETLPMSHEGDQA